MDDLAGALSRLSKQELQAVARALDLKGRSRMSKSQLVEGLAEAMSPGRPLERGGSASQRRRHLYDRLAGCVDEERVCSFRTLEGFACGMPPVRGQHRCSLHGGVDASDLAVPAAGRLGPESWPALLRHLRLVTYDVDALGLDPVIAELLWHLGNSLYFGYFRVDVEGVEHVPMNGPAILAANHGGSALPYDGLMLQLAVANECPRPRRVRVMGTEIFNMLPFVSHLYRKSGAAYAAREDARWVLAKGYLLGVFPEGVKGFQKPLSEAYRLRKFGRGGFVQLARGAGAPIVPVAILGSEEVHPALFTSRRLASLVRLVFPQQRVEEMGVWVNPVPLPVKWKIRFLPPIDPEPAADRLAALETAEEVRARIQASLDAMRAARGSTF